MNWVSLDVVKTLRWTDVVSKSSNWCRVSSHIIVLPLSKKSNDKVSSEFSCENLGEEVNVGNKSGLENNWNVGGIEQLDWVWLSETSHLSATEGKLNSEALLWKRVSKMKNVHLPGNR